MVKLSRTVRWVTSTLATLTAAVTIVTLSGCGSSSSTSSSPVTTSAATSSTQSPASSASGQTTAGGVSARSVEHALVAHGSPPAPTMATCHVSTAAERAAAPFGHTPLPEFTCALTLTGKRASFAVQVQRNGCFVAERHGGGQAVYGCGVARS